MHAPRKRLTAIVYLMRMSIEKKTFEWMKKTKAGFTVKVPVADGRAGAVYKAIRVSHFFNSSGPAEL